MKKLDKPQSKEYGPLIIWAADFTEIFSELESCSNIEFIAADVKFDSVEEFIKESRGGNPAEVKITAHDPYLSVELYQRWARLYVSSSELKPSGLFLKIDAILSRCERKPKFFFQYFWVVGSTWAIPIIFYFPLLKPYDYLGLWVTMLTFSWLMYVGFIHLWRFSVIRPMYREDRPSFFRRNIDAIVIAVISAMLGAVGGAAAIKVAEKVWPSSPNPVVERDAPGATQPPVATPQLKR